MRISITNKEIKELRKKLNLNQAEFASLLKISISTLERWEANGIDFSGGTPLNNLNELRTVIKDKECLRTITDILNSDLGTDKLMVASSMISVLHTIVTAGFLGVFLGYRFIDILQSFLLSKKDEIKKIFFSGESNFDIPSLTNVINKAFTNVDLKK